MNPKFPTVEEKNIVLLRADALTGIVLDDQFKRVLSSDQNVYSIFNHYEDAISYIESVIKYKPNIEAVVYNSREEVLYYYNPFEKTRKE